ncbi:MAG: DUF4358 domain-containing protein [Bacillus sp. (in: firmicutes)]
MKRKFSVCMMMFFLLLGVVGCGNNEADNEKDDVKLEEILTSIKEQIAEDLEAGGVEEAIVEGNLQGYTEVDLLSTNDSNAAIYIEKLNMDTDALEEGFILQPMMNVKSDEIILLKAKDEEHVDKLKELLEAEKLVQVETWERYLPDQYEKVKNNVIKVNGSYLLYVTYENPEKIVQIFENNLK